eukprot:4846279-Pyramimonas_sp.AAC.1
MATDGDGAGGGLGIPMRFETKKHVPVAGLGSPLIFGDKIGACGGLVLPPFAFGGNRNRRLRWA